MFQDDLSPAAITENLTTRFIGQRLVYYPSLASTIDVARAEARQGAAEGMVVLAGEQTAGRGRIKRPWLSPAGSVALSLLLRPPISFLPSLVMVASLAVARAIGQATGLKAQIKWPNDVLIDGKKVCGILIESEVRGQQVDFAIVSAGINVNLDPTAYPEIAHRATSLAHELGKPVSRHELVRCLLAEFEGLYLTLPGDDVFHQWRDGLVTLGKRVRVTSDETVTEGLAESVTRDGSLHLRLPDGRRLKVVAGDVTLRG